MSNNNSGPKNSKIVPLFITFAILFVVVFGLGVIIGKGLGGPDTNTIERSYDIETPEVEYGTPDDITIEESDTADIESEVVVLDEDDPAADNDTEGRSEDTENTESQEKETAKVVTPTKAPVEVKATKKPEPEPKKVIEEKETAEIIVEKPTTPEKKSPKDSGPMPKVDPNGLYTVQIGAFQNQTEANKLMNSLKSNGYPAFIKQTETPDKKIWYRVRVGTFSTRPDAISYGDKLKQRASGVKYVFITTNN
ncbi:MAG: SPOR domain-containing protein [Thermodesulfobacteriota bacterium]